MGGISGGAKAAVHAAQRLVTTTQDDVIVKLDFSDALYCVRRDFVLDNVAANTPEVYRLVHAAYSLSLHEYQILSTEGGTLRKGVPLGSLEFHEAVHPLLTSLHSEVMIGFMELKRWDSLLGPRRTLYGSATRPSSALNKLMMLLLSDC